MFDKSFLKKIFTEKIYDFYRVNENKCHLIKNNKKISVIILPDKLYYNLTRCIECKNCKIINFKSGINQNYKNIYFNYSYIKYILRHKTLSKIIE